MNTDSPDSKNTQGIESPEELLKGFERKKIRRGIVLFTVLTIAALTVLCIATHSADVTVALRNYETGFLALTILLLAADMCLGALRNHIFIRKLSPDISFFTSFRANLANIFMGAITPSKGGGGPVQLFIYHRAGVSIGKAISAAVLNYLSTLIVFISGAVFAFMILRDSTGGDIVRGVILTCFLVFFIQLIIVIFALIRPDLFVRSVRGFTGWVEGKMPATGRYLCRVADRVAHEVGAYRDSCRLFLGKHRTIMLLSVVLTFMLYINKYIIAYFVMRGLGVDGDIMNVIAIQAIIMCILYFSPSPGGSGIAELSIATLMASVMPENTLGIFTLLQRFFLLYVPALLGAVIVFREFHSIHGSDYVSASKRKERYSGSDSIQTG